MKQFIFFRNDRLGDFLIITNLINAVKKKYPSANITVVSSKYNHHFILKYKIIDKVILYDKNFSILNKIKIFKKILNKNYDASFTLDGKSFSFLCNLFIKSKKKFALFYKYKLFGIPFLKPNVLHTFFCDYYETFTSKKYLTQIEHLPSKFINLGNYLDLKINQNDKYYFLPSVNANKIKIKIKKIIKGKYVLIHLDEKWMDIKDINDNFYDNLNLFQKKINKKILLTSFKNGFDYFINLKNQLKKKNNNNIILLENSSLDLMERLIYYSSFAISCHSGFLVQISGTNNSKVIDIINKKDYNWYSCWVPRNTFHKFVFKSNNRQFFELKKILFDIFKIIKK
tara:strand:- start:740 stop:1762 length:1023 start_codon:yes stop_codon:yes gene_type:complete